MWFSQDEMLALMTIQSMIVQLEPGLLGPKLKPFQKRLDDMLASQGLDAAALTQRVRAVHAGKRRLPLTSFETLTKATLERQQVPVEHLNRQKGETVLRDISPSNWCTTGTTGMRTPGATCVVACVAFLSKPSQAPRCCTNPAKTST